MFGALTPEIENGFRIARKKRKKKKKKKVEEGSDCSPSNSWPVTSPAVTSRPRFFTYEVPRVVTNRFIRTGLSSLLIFLFFAVVPARPVPFPFRCFYISLFLLNNLDTALPVTRTVLMSLLHLSRESSSLR